MCDIAKKQADYLATVVNRYLVFILGFENFTVKRKVSSEPK